MITSNKKEKYTQKCNIRKTSTISKLIQIAFWSLFNKLYQFIKNN